ncbi:MAG: hypothetical protein IPJ93_12320 [Bacteroidota bacterium]|nr:MAG: hypothetical protein IPJ93_12320 [Bacteroidota bacterium]
MKLFIKKIPALLISILLSANCVFAQSVTAVLQLDTNRIVAGQQITAKLRFTAPADYQTKWVAIPDTFNGIDVISRLPIDTLPSANKSLITREQKFTLTAFDSGFFVITPFVFSYKKTDDTTNYTVETHEIAIEQLEHLQQEKLWQQGNFKMYYTQLSDIMRAYISNRWNFDAMESTTDEIMHSNTALQLSNDNFNRLKSTLTLSDLAKFAKYTPLSNENEQAMTDAFIFVNETKVVLTTKPQEQVKP